MVLEVLRLPEIPGSDENFSVGFEVFLDLLEDKELIRFGG